MRPSHFALRKQPCLPKRRRESGLSRSRFSAPVGLGLDMPLGGGDKGQRLLTKGLVFVKKCVRKIGGDTYNTPWQHGKCLFVSLTCVSTVLADAPHFN